MSATTTQKKPTRSTTMNTWRLSFHGLRTVVGLELSQRIRSRRWLVALVAWFVVIGAMTTLLVASNSKWNDRYDMTGTYLGPAPAGPMVFGIIVLFILGAGLVIAPAFTATSINGDRNQGTLATLQATALSSAEIVAGKLVAAWCIAGAFMVAALPFLVWSMVIGSIPVLRTLVCFAVVFAEIAVVCAVGLGFSALFNRSAASTVMTYVVVAALSLLTLIVPAVATVLTVRETTIHAYGLPEHVQDEWDEALFAWYEDHPDAFWYEWEGEEEATAKDFPVPPVQKCTEYEYTSWEAHTERVWWMVVPNPFVVVADAAPVSSSGPPRYWGEEDTNPLATIRLAVREVAQGPELVVDECAWLYSYMGYDVWQDRTVGTTVITAPDGSSPDYVSQVPPTELSQAPVWPWGLGVNLLLGGLFFWVAVRRLRIPYRALPKGTRVA
ncbi:MAG: ABC transporter permease [Micrococcales bacterium]|nr:ABC transporter permease [Micrococcales bacterium]